MTAGARVRVLALGHPFRGDDGAALDVARRLRTLAPSADVGEVGRPGPGLLDHLDPAVPTVLLDVVVTGAAPGTVLSIPLDRVTSAVVREGRASSHGLGPADALALSAALGRPLPRGWLVGCEGARFDAGAGRSPGVEAAMDGWTAAALAAVEDLCTSTGSSTGS